MSLAYPIAKTARAALASADQAARTRREAEKLSDNLIAALETEWLTPTAKDLAKWLDKADQGPGAGFLQHYEDASGKTVLAVTYWKITSRKAKADKPATVSKPAEDHTDDLYFRHNRSKKKHKPKPVDPNQLALFDPPTDEKP